MPQNTNSRPRIIDTKRDNGHEESTRISNNPSEEFPNHKDGQKGPESDELQFGLQGPENQGTFQGDILLAWSPREYEFQEKGQNWYLAAGITAALLIAGSIIFRNYLMAVTFFLLAVVVYIYSERKPLQIPVELRDYGVRVKGRYYSYRDLKRFWIIYRPGDVTTLNFETDNVFNQTLVIQLEDQNPNIVRNILKDKLPEDINQVDSQLDQIARNFKI